MAQPATHFFLGAVFAQTTLIINPVRIFPNIPWFLEVISLWCACTLGALLPDVPTGINFFFGKQKGKEAMKNQGKIAITMKEVSHSIFVWMFLIYIAILLPDSWITTFLLFTFWCGLIAGVLPDIPTHSEERFREKDCTYLFPLNKVFETLFGFRALRWPNDEWEYRADHGGLWPITRGCLKPWEWLLIRMLICVFLLELLFYVYLYL